MFRDWAAHRVFVFHLMKISFVKPEACVIIFNTASPVNKFMNQRNKKIKNVLYVAAHAPPFFIFSWQRGSKKPEICRLTFTTTSSIPNISKFHFLVNIDFSCRWFINLFTDEAVLNIIAQASGFTKLIFMGWKTRNPMSSLIPEHKNSRSCLFRGRFFIVEAVWNIIVQPTAFVRVFYSI